MPKSGNVGLVWIYGHAASASTISNSTVGSIRACFYNTGISLKMGPCSGKPGTVIAITLARAIKSPLANVGSPKNGPE